MSYEGGDSKYGLIYSSKRQGKGEQFPEDEPMFLIRGQDKAAPTAIRSYAEWAMNAGASPTFYHAVLAQAERIEAWQKEHPDRVKVPD